MGVEYSHFLVVGEKNWSPQTDTLTRVNEVLRRWSLVDAVDKVFDLSSMTEDPEPVVPCGPTGPGKAVVYRDAARGNCVEVVAGPSYYGTVETEDRYIQTVVAIAGSDFRIQQSDEYCWFEVVGPLHGLDEADPSFDDIPWPVTKAFFEYQINEKSVDHPVVKTHLGKHWSELYEWESYHGYWRGGVVLDFGKDLPKFCETRRTLASAEFVAELAAAFRGPIVEVGVIY